MDFCPIWYPGVLVMVMVIVEAAVWLSVISSSLLFLMIAVCCLKGRVGVMVFERWMFAESRSEIVCKAVSGFFSLVSLVIPLHIGSNRFTLKQANLQIFLCYNGLLMDIECCRRFSEALHGDDV